MKKTKQSQVNIKKSRWKNIPWMKRVLIVQDFPIWPCKLRQDAWGCKEKIGVKPRLLNEETWWILTTLHEYTTVFELSPIYRISVSSVSSFLWAIWWLGFATGWKGTSKAFVDPKIEKRLNEAVEEHDDKRAVEVFPMFRLKSHPD